MSDTMKPLTEVERRALEILRDHGPIHPREFGHLLWPDNPAWNNHTKAGNRGTTHGGGMNLASGAYLGRLRKKGWARQPFNPHDPLDNSWVITPAGYNALDRSKDETS